MTSVTTRNWILSVAIDGVLRPLTRGAETRTGLRPQRALASPGLAPGVLVKSRIFHHHQLPCSRSWPGQTLLDFLASSGYPLTAALRFLAYSLLVGGLCPRQCSRARWASKNCQSLVPCERKRWQGRGTGLQVGRPLWCEGGALHFRFCQANSSRSSSASWPAL